LKSVFLSRLKKELELQKDVPVEDKKDGGLNLIVFFSVGVLVSILIATSTYALILLPIIGTYQYLYYLINSEMAILIPLSLFGAVVFATAAFSTAAQQARFTRDASIIALFIWIGLSLLVTYHVLWMLYFLLITSIWPLRVITPK